MMFTLIYAHITNMGTHMKTTVELSDALFESAKQVARQNKTTMRALIEEGLRKVIADVKVSKRTAFKLRDASVKGSAQLVKDPKDWHNFEQEHIRARLTKT
jgi:hypothetical protein